MVADMLKKNWFVFVVLILYLLFLAKDHLFGFLDNTSDLMSAIYDEKLNYYKREYEEMRQLLDITYQDYEAIYSKVIMRDIYEFYKEFTIGKGSNDGIAKQDVVINEQGVVGIVKKVYPSSSIVELLTSPDIQLSVRINDSYGILTSIDEKIIVKNIKLNQEIKEGDKVYTSGLTNIPGGLLVGVIKSIDTDSLELEYLLEVESITHLQDISYVAVIQSGKEAES